MAGPQNQFDRNLPPPPWPKELLIGFALVVVIAVFILSGKL
jgi:hypothetical protein